MASEHSYRISTPDTIDKIADFLCKSIAYEYESISFEIGNTEWRAALMKRKRSEEDGLDFAKREFNNAFFRDIIVSGSLLRPLGKENSVLPDQFVVCFIPDIHTLKEISSCSLKRSVIFYYNGDSSENQFITNFSDNIEASLYIKLSELEEHLQRMSKLKQETVKEQMQKIIISEQQEKFSKIDYSRKLIEEERSLLVEDRRWYEAKLKEDIEKREYENIEDRRWYESRLKEEMEKREQDRRWYESKLKENEEANSVKIKDLKETQRVKIKIIKEQVEKQLRNKKEEELVNKSFKCEIF